MWETSKTGERWDATGCQGLGDHCSIFQNHKARLWTFMSPLQSVTPLMCTNRFLFCVEININPVATQKIKCIQISKTVNCISKHCFETVWICWVWFVYFCTWQILRSGQQHNRGDLERSRGGRLWHWYLRGEKTDFIVSWFSWFDSLYLHLTYSSRALVAALKMILLLYSKTHNVSWLCNNATFFQCMGTRNNLPSCFLTLFHYILLCFLRCTLPVFKMSQEIWCYFPSKELKCWQKKKLS